jgi:TonB-linked SusC/RagA family outer membrane protein
MIIACLSLKAQAKENSGDRTVEINIHEIPVRVLFNIINKQTGILFTYSNDEFDDKMKITLVAHNKPLKRVLTQIFNNTEFIWEYKNGNVVVKRRVNDPDLLKKIGSYSSSPSDSLVTLSGIVKDEKGKPIPGISVVINGTKIGTSTNEEGVFVLKNVPQQSYLTFSSIGFASQQYKVASLKGWQAFILKESISVLDGAVVEAYSVTSKRYSTSSISTVSSKDIEKKPVTNVLLAIQAEVPGIVIQQSSGVVNAGISVLIRGLNSLQKGTDPLYVIDGVPYTSQLMQTVNNYALGYSGQEGRQFVMQGNPLSFINPSDIESISILKDADATSIYGSRAAAGAILITTKKGKIGATKYNVNFQQGWGKVARFVDLLNKDQYLALRHEAKMNTNQAIFPSDFDLNGTWDTTRSTDWQRTLLGGTARSSDLQVSASGGSDNTQFLVGVGYNRQTSVFLSDLLDKRGSVHFNLNNTSLNKRFNIQLTGSYMVDDNQPPVSTLASTSLLLPPVAPALFNKDGSLNWAPNSNGNSTWDNPLANGRVKSRTTTNNLTSSMLLTYNLARGLKIKSSFGYNNMQINEFRGIPFTSFSPEQQSSGRARTADFSNGNIRSWIIEPQLSYEHIGGKSRIEALLGSTIQNNKYAQQLLNGSGYGSDQLLEDILSAPVVKVTGTTASIYRYNALFGRINYKIKDRYIFNLSARRDGSSRFGSNNRFHNFASIGAAWIFSDEAFFSRLSKVVTFGKIQTSYGSTGNDQIGDYLYLNIYGSESTAVPYQGLVGLSPGGPPNPNLQWESTKKMQGSLDLGFANNKILINATYFRNRSSNQLVNYLVPAITGVSSYTKNLPATIQNMGWEFSGNADVIRNKKFSWSFKLNFYIPQNKLISFPGIENSSYATTYIVGKPITSARVYTFGGVDPQTGLYQFKDYKGDLTKSPDYMTDKMKVLNLAPAYTAGYSNSLSYKGFQLDFLLQLNKQWVSSGVFGAAVPGYMRNQPSTILNRWKKTGDIAQVQKATSGDFSIINQYFTALGSDAQFMNCTYLRIKNVSLSWALPDSWCRISKIDYAKFFVHTQNLYTFTNYVGADPETGYSATLPPLRTITIGLQVGL